MLNMKYIKTMEKSYDLLLRHLQLGGFKLPFISLGCVMLVVTLVTIWAMPSQACKSVIWVIRIWLFEFSLN